MKFSAEKMFLATERKSISRVSASGVIPGPSTLSPSPLPTPNGIPKVDQKVTYLSISVLLDAAAADSVAVCTENKKE